jgi:hypothetical protein
MMFLLGAPIFWMNNLVLKNDNVIYLLEQMESQSSLHNQNHNWDIASIDKTTDIIEKR